jgi:ABC-type multidrug transport system fused ATPase/permease subunit
MRYNLDPHGIKTDAELEAAMRDVSYWNEGLLDFEVAIGGENLSVGQK